MIAKRDDRHQLKAAHLGPKSEASGAPCDSKGIDRVLAGDILPPGTFQADLRQWAKAFAAAEVERAAKLADVKVCGEYGQDCLVATEIAVSVRAMEIGEPP